MAKSSKNRSDNLNDQENQTVQFALEIGNKSQLESLQFLQSDENPGDLTVAAQDGSKVVVPNYIILSQAGLPPNLTLADGTVISGDEVLGLVEGLDFDKIAPAAGDQGPDSDISGAAFSPYSNSVLGDDLEHGSYAGNGSIEDSSVTGIAAERTQDTVSTAPEINLPPVGGDDTVITNITDMENIMVPERALLANDIDPNRGDILSVDDNLFETGWRAEFGTSIPSVGERESNHLTGMTDASQNIPRSAFAISDPDTAVVQVTGSLADYDRKSIYNDAFKVELKAGETLDLSVNPGIEMFVYRLPLQDLAPIGGDGNADPDYSSATGQLDGITGAGVYVVKVLTHNNSGDSFNLQMQLSDIADPEEFIQEWQEGSDNNWAVTDYPASGDPTVTGSVQAINVARSDFRATSTTAAAFLMSGRVGDHDNGDIWNDAFQFEVKDGEQFSVEFTASTTPGAELMVFRSNGSGWEYQGDGSTPFTGGGTYLAKIWTDNSGGVDYQLRAELSEWHTSHSYNVSDDDTPALTDTDVAVDIQRQYGDEITGTDSAEILLGGSSDDTLLAQDGNDVLVGGGGDDTLTGGDGDDMFLFTAATDGHDTITDFLSGDDSINLDVLFDNMSIDEADRVVDAEIVGPNTVLRVGTESGGVFTDETGGAFSVTIEGATLSNNDVDTMINQGNIVVDES